MKILKRSLQIIIISISFLTGASVFAERINNFTSDISINSDASITVTETIVYDFENNQRHGIFRFIPLQYMVNGEQREDRNTYSMNISVSSVDRGGVSESFTVENTSNNISIKIGNASKKIQGTQVYTIRYKVTGALRYFDEYDELYWNATGSEWEVPIDAATVTLKSNTLVFDNFFCYAGFNNSQNSCANKNKDGNSLLFSQTNLDPGQGITIAASFEKGIVPVVQNQIIITKKSIFYIIWNDFRGLLLFPLVGFMYIGFYLFKRKHYVKKSVMTQYEPAKEFNPMFTGYIMDLRFDPRDISAGIIYAAQQGYFTIEYVPKARWLGSDDYIFRLNQEKFDSEKNIPEEINFILKLIFQKQDIQSIYGSIGLGGLEPTQLSRSRNLSDIKKESGNRLYEKNEIIKYFKHILIAKKLMEKARFIFSKATRLTGDGWDIRLHLKGFKRFLSMTEKDRYEFHNNINNPGATFMEYLPYAIAFGVEKKWAKQFKDIAIDQPDWYQSKNTGSIALASSLSNFSKTLTSSVTPARGSGSGSRGSGSSGGGSGGGGGGSW